MLLLEMRGGVPHPIQCRKIKNRGGAIMHVALSLGYAKAHAKHTQWGMYFGLGRLG